MMRVIFVLGVSACLLAAPDPPSAQVSNGPIRAKIYLPDAKAGYYRGTRFDWSGVVYSLQSQGHEFYGPWFNRTDPKVHDFVYDGPDIVAGPCSAITGPVDEFGQIGWEQAKVGGPFLKIGVGVLRKPAEGKYDAFRVYEIANAGKWTVSRQRESVEFTHNVLDSSSGYGYEYRKTVRLPPGKPEMALEHRLKNTGKLAIRTHVYNHNFLVLDGQPTGPGFTIAVPFPIRTERPPNARLAEVQENRIVYVKKLEGRDVVSTPVEGFSQSAKDHDIRIENAVLGAGMRIRADRPLSRESLWSIRTVIAMEPFIAVEIEPGKEFTWTTTYDYYTLPRAK
jgi:hypothetical protein